MAPTIILARLFGRLGARATVIALFCVSAMALMALGLPYGSAGGSALLKIHPASYLAALTAPVIVLTTGSPGRHIAHLLARHPGLMAFGAAIVLLGFHGVIIQKLPASAAIDTFVLPFLLFVILTAISPGDRRWLVLFLHGFFIANSGLGYLEQLTSLRLTPPILGGEVAAYEWRSTAMLGHPLANASATGLYLILLSGPGGGTVPYALRIGLLAFHAGAMFTFGGRTAFVLLLAAILVRAAVGLARTLAGQRLSLTRTRLATAAIFGVMVLGTAAGTAGAFDRFVGRFVDDSGSAATRGAMLHVFDDVPLSGVMLGPDPQSIAVAQRRLDIAIAIESFPIAFAAQYGVIVSGLFFLGLACFFAEILRLSGPAAVLPIVYWLVVNAGANSIAAKTLELAISVTMMVLLRPDPAVQREAAAVAPLRRIARPSPSW